MPPRHEQQVRRCLNRRRSVIHGQDRQAVAMEERYLDGHPALFPAAVPAWEEQLKSTKAIADLASRLAEFDGVAPAAPTDPDAASIRATELVADLVEPAKATALEKLGEGAQALGIGADWLRPKLEPVGSSPQAPP